ncbi:MULTISPECIES: nitrogen fixation protein NifZ [unclassified Halorhodospira]|uniref:nitrogen fixation protein NifZ n=1 Tax=unclassified Halorhodospira TaxID=2626748 RepID=UPI003084514A
MLPRFRIGAAVRVARNIRNDGTYPGVARGELLVPRGSVGYVRDVGTFLQDQIVYSVFFLDQDRMVGCREEELMDAASHWVETRFEFRDRVTPTRRLAVHGEVVAEPGAVGEIIRVMRDARTGPAYQVRFPGRTLQVPEHALAPLAAEVPEVTDEDVERFYREHPERFQRDETRTVRHLLITINDEFPENTRQRAWARAEKLAGKLADDPRGFAAAAERHSECPSALHGGLVGRVARGQLHEELDAALFEMAAGEVRGPVETAMGLHVLLCETVHPPDVAPLDDELRERIRGALQEKRARQVQRDRARAGQGGENHEPSGTG